MRDLLAITKALGGREPGAGHRPAPRAGALSVPDHRGARARPLDRLEAHVDSAPGAACRVSQRRALGLLPARWKTTPLPPALQALELVLASLKQDKQGKADQQQLKAVLKMEPEELCRKQANCRC